MSGNTKITILGGGNGAFAAAADLTIRGFEITLCELPQFKKNIESAQKIGGINLEVLESTNLKGGFAKLSKITTNFKEALENAEVIFIIVPAFGQSEIARQCAPYLKDGQVVLLTPGSFGGSINFFNEIRKLGNLKDIKIAEAESMMYACRKKDEISVWIRGYKHNLGIAVFPAKDTELVYSKLKKIYPTFIYRNNVLETSLSNANPILHIPIMLFNLSNIENKKDMLFYHECLTESIGKIVDKIDEERMALNKKVGIDLIPIAKIAKSFYAYQGAKGKNMYELHHSNPIYKWSKLPTSLENRYLTEDIPFGLIPFYKLAEKFNSPHTYMKAIADLGCLITGKNFYESARDLKKLNLDNYNQKQLIDFVTFGYV